VRSKGVPKAFRASQRREKCAFLPTQYPYIERARHREVVRRAREAASRGQCPAEGLKRLAADSRTPLERLWNGFGTLAGETGSVEPTAPVVGAASVVCAPVARVLMRLNLSPSLARKQATPS
jgi:hypothetical protein